MVLQRDRPIRIYGTGIAGETISVKLGDSAGATVIPRTGKWQVELPPRQANSKPISLSASNGTQKTTLKDIVIGDIWVCSGQSNMGWQTKNTQPQPETFPHSDTLRVLTGKLVVSTETTLDAFTPDPTASPSGWERAGKDQALRTSAVAYYMGLEICKQADIPVGLVVVALGGSQIYPWMTPASINGHPEENMAKTEAATALRWANGRAKEFVAIGQQEKADKLLYAYEGKAPSALYRGMIAPLTNMPITGMLWYQGERSQDNPAPYRTLFPAAITGWRQAWGQGDFPFVFVQLPAYFGEGSKEKRARGFSLVREAQELALRLPETGMAMALEYGHYLDVHPQEKNEVGRRAGLQALRLTGHAVLADGPIEQSIKLDGEKAVIQFKSVAKGLEARLVKLPRTKGTIGKTDPHAFIVAANELRGFELCGRDGVFKPAHARIVDGKTIVATATGVEEVHHVRYAFHQFPICNLYNSEGLPARPFRTDDFHIPSGKE
jgi:sialate O-acetylesterase